MSMGLLGYIVETRIIPVVFWRGLISGSFAKPLVINLQFILYPPSSFTLNQLQKYVKNIIVFQLLFCGVGGEGGVL